MKLAEDMSRSAGLEAHADCTVSNHNGIKERPSASTDAARHFLSVLLLPVTQYSTMMSQ